MDSNRIKLDGRNTCSSNFVFICLLLLLLSTSAQAGSDSLRVDSLSVPKDHSPRKATLMSVFVPGLGQAYNRKYWKMPIIYAGLGTAIYFVKFNNDYFQRYRKGYISLLNKDTLNDPFKGLYSTEQLSNAKEYYRRNRDLSIVIATGVYILNIIDAAVDAHLFYFDISDDLAVRVRPSVFSLGYGEMPASAPGLSLTFLLNKKD